MKLSLYRSFLPDMIGKPSWVKFIFPNAPFQPVTINGGMKMPRCSLCPLHLTHVVNAMPQLVRYLRGARFPSRICDANADGSQLGGSSSENRPQDEKGMLDSARIITDLLAAEVDAGIPANRVILGGFSQGAVISLLAGLTSERRVAGIVALSGYLPIHGKIASVCLFVQSGTPVASASVQMTTDHARTLPLFWGHGKSSHSCTPKSCRAEVVLHRRIRRSCTVWRCLSASIDVS